MTGPPQVLFCTWTTYGTWLPGDRRGYVSNTLCPGGGFAPKRNRPGTPYARDDPFTRRRAQALQKHETVRLTADEAFIAALALVEAAASRRWRIVRGAVMADHVHVVVRLPLESATPERRGPTPPLRGLDPPPPPRKGSVRRVLKGRSSAFLSDHLRGGIPRRWWTAGGSDRLRTGTRSVAATVRYVDRQPGMLAYIVDNTVGAPPDPAPDY